MAIEASRAGAAAKSVTRAFFKGSGQIADNVMAIVNIQNARYNNNLKNLALTLIEQGKEEGCEFELA